MREGRVTANGIDFSFIEEGQGPLVLLQHGFPDTRTTWDEIIPRLAEAGFRAVAPNTRGYPPTSTGEFFDIGTRALDTRELIRALGAERAHLVGHDWGAAATYYACAAFPDAIDRAVTIALPHPVAIAARLFLPESIHRAFHFWFFQLPDLPEGAIPANDFAFIDYLWELWSPGHKDPDQIAQVKRTLAEPGAVASAIGYYRAMFDHARQDPATAYVRDAIGQPIATPTLTILGSHDLGLAEPAALKGFFSGEFDVEVIDDAGHFAHRENPDAVSDLIVNWLKR